MLGHRIERSKGTAFGVPMDSQARRLSAPQRTRVQTEVARPPQSLGYSEGAWNGALLSHHLHYRYGIDLGERQCRRLLRAFGIPPGPARRNLTTRARESVGATRMPHTDSGWLARRPISGPMQRELALRKIRRLASSGLPLYPFVLTLFGLMAEAIPGGDLPQAIQTDPSSNLSWIFTNLDQAKWVPVLAKLIGGHSPEAWPGLRPRDQLDPARSVLMLEEFTTPDYRRSALYNEFFHPLRLEQGMLTQIREVGEPVGFYPLYRSAAMKPFDRDHLAFLASAAPHIAHGLRSARLIDACSVSSVEPVRSLDGSPGMIVMSKAGRILGHDQRARSLFFQVGLCDGLPAPAFAEGGLRSVLDYVARTLRAIFDDRERATGEFAAPVARIMSHKAGIALRLRAYATPGEGADDLCVVLVEQVEPEELARQRLIYRYGLAPREAEVLVLLGERLSADRLARELGISTSTVKTYIRQIISKLSVDSLPALREFLEREHLAARKSDIRPSIQRAL
jgi:DNA-binding CsgD family transcriptional regulator